jgi:phosphoribosyl 1,2-cyclic phosphodiesterase
VRVKVWGCRGSLAAPGPDTVRYGGNTSCVEVRLADGTIVVLDAGTGIRALGLSLEAEGVKRVHLCLSHLHLDHLQGLGFFAPLFDADAEVHIWGPRSPVRSLAERIGTYLSPPLFPVRLSQIPSRLVFHDVSEEGWTIGEAKVFAVPVSHPDSTVGYRIEEGGRVLAYIPDHEPALGIDITTVEPNWISGHGLAADADLLLHDAQYSAEEYPDHVGWGHSSIDDAIAFGRATRASRLLLFHHDPSHSDDVLERLEALAVPKHPSVGLAREGMSVEVGA